MRILVTNDDGIDSLGLHVLARAMCHHGDVVVVAPDTEYSGAGAALGAIHKIHPEVHRRSIDGITESWAVEGAPALCVLYARLGAFGGPFDLVVAGINPGANVGRSIYHSGTVGAALTARNSGITSLAVSQSVADSDVEGQAEDDRLEGQRWETAAQIAEAVVAALVADPPPAAVALNINVPNRSIDDLLGWRATTVGVTPARAMASAELVTKPGHPGTFGVRTTWGDRLEMPADSDGGAVERGYVSLTALGSLTAADHAAPAGVSNALDGLLTGV
jgi:5'-nucleotidase